MQEVVQLLPLHGLGFDSFDVDGQLGLEGLDLIGEVETSQHRGAVGIDHATTGNITHEAINMSSESLNAFRFFARNNGEVLSVNGYVNRVGQW